MILYVIYNVILMPTVLVQSLKPTDDSKTKMTDIVYYSQRIMLYWSMYLSKHISDIQRMLIYPEVCFYAFVLCKVHINNLSHGRSGSENR